MTATPEQPDRENLIARASWWSGWCSDNSDYALPELAQLGDFLLDVKHQIALDRPAPATEDDQPGNATDGSYDGTEGCEPENEDDEPVAWAIYGRVSGNLKEVTTIDQTVQDMRDDPTYTPEPTLWHVQYADSTRDCDGTYPLTARYVMARCEDDAHNRAEEDYDTSDGVAETEQYDTRPATPTEVRQWLAALSPASTSGEGDRG